MEKNLIAQASTDIDASPKEVWKALLDPEAIRQYMFGARVDSDWREGSPIVWRGEWKGKAYEDKGVVLRVRPEQKLEYSHFSPLSGMRDEPENYHTVTIELAPRGNGTRVALAQDKNRTEEARDHSQKNWEMMLEGLKKVVET
jgi:uncharacterized protein YndB with AHSA1/START domain